jgi:hypothetical protein
MPAESPARINRLTPNATRTKIVNSTPVFPSKIKIETTVSVIARIRFEYAIARCLETRSRIVPTNGPTIEYGSSTTANARAALKALA